MRKLLILAALTGAGLAASGCANNVKGSWACAIERGGVCASITDIDRGVAGRPPEGQAAYRRSGASVDPIVDGAIPAVLAGQGGWTAGSIAGAPVREGDPIVRVAVAPWVDGPGDYHAGSEVYAVMRHGAWYRPAHVQRIELAGAPLVSPRVAEPIATIEPAPPRAATVATAAPNVASPEPKLAGAPQVAASGPVSR